jgi:hypothetical protein
MARTKYSMIEKENDICGFHISMNIQFLRIFIIAMRMRRSDI